MNREFRWSERSFLLAIFLLAFVLRVALMLYFRSYLFPSENNYWHYGYEVSRIAASISRGEGFSSPFPYPHPTGPTSWLAPAYPYLVAGIFKIFGVYSKSSAVVIFLLQSLFSALTCVIIYYISKRLFGSIEAAALAAVLLAVYPTSIWFSINYIWDDSLLVLCLSITFLFLIHLPENPGLKRALVTGLLMGLALLVSPVVLSFYLSALAYIGWRARAKKREALLFVTVACTTVVLVLLPWLIRNYLTFGQIGLIKSGFGVELRIGNNPYATGMFTLAHGKRLHPSLVDEEFARYVRMGEIDYSRHCYDEAMAFIKENPNRFLRLCLKRIYYFWLGDPEEKKVWLGNFGRFIPSALLIKKLSIVGPLPFLVVGLVTAWRRRQAIVLTMLLFLMFPLVYYITHALVKYRYYIDALILVFATYGFCTVVDYILRMRVEGRSRLKAARMKEESVRRKAER